MNANLLVELFTEELPPKALKRLGDAFAQGIADHLKGVALLDAASQVKSFATPRRLAAYITLVTDKGRDRPVEQKLMPATIARGADGAWSDALRKKLAALGKAALADVAAGTKVGPDQLAIKSDGKVDSVYLKSVEPGRTLEAALNEAIDVATAKLPIPKVMSYQLADGTTTVKFVRPAHGLVALHGANIVNVAALGLVAGRATHGHRFQSPLAEIKLERADEYEARLEREGMVMADFDARHANIGMQLREKALALKMTLGAESDYMPLLDEVAALVEYPTVYIGEFDAEFLAVPQECLILTMRQNQKYFPLFDGAGKLTNNFLIVSNMRLINSKNVVEGNQRVVRPRLADARFFFETDKKTKLEGRVQQLASVVYHNKLGTQLERVERVRNLAQFVAEKIGADPMLANRAALLSKGDLVTGMVGEFPELQGIMGRYYALADGEDLQVANAIEQHYRPRFSGDQLPEGMVAKAVALADKLDAIAGLFSIGQIPTGDKDPFGLRRAALGVIRILVEGKLQLSLHELANAACGQFSSQTPVELIQFVNDRFAGYLKDKGYSTLQIEAVQSSNPFRPDLSLDLLEAVKAFQALPEAESLAAANKRIVNILKQANAKGESPSKVEKKVLTEPAELALYEAIRSTSDKAKRLFEGGDYAGYLKSFSVLREPVDAFFEKVMVMVEDDKIRLNRLALLNDLRESMNRVADISKLAA